MDTRRRFAFNCRPSSASETLPSLKTLNVKLRPAANKPDPPNRTSFGVVRPAGLCGGCGDVALWEEGVGALVNQCMTGPVDKSPLPRGHRTLLRGMEATPCLRHNSTGSRSGPGLSKSAGCMHYSELFEINCSYCLLQATDKGCFQ